MAHDTRAHHILLVEDDPEISALLAALLMKNGFRVTCCEDGLAALETFRQGGFSLVILDGMLPGMDGYAICGEIRKAEQRERTPVIFLSALAQKSEIDRGLAAGADIYITKPYENAYLLEEIRKLL